MVTFLCVLTWQREISFPLFIRQKWSPHGSKGRSPGWWRERWQVLHVQVIDKQQASGSHHSSHLNWSSNLDPWGDRRELPHEPPKKSFYPHPSFSVTPFVIVLVLGYFVYIVTVRDRRMSSWTGQVIYQWLEWMKGLVQCHEKPSQERVMERDFSLSRLR